MARPRTSKHRVSKRKVVEVERHWHDDHIAAGYHDQEWGEPSKDDHDLHGTYEATTAATPGQIVVSHVDNHPVVGGPTFRLALPGGHSVDVLDADTVRAYLGLHGVEGFERLDVPEIE